MCSIYYCVIIDKSRVNVILSDYNIKKIMMIGPISEPTTDQGHFYWKSVLFMNLVIEYEFYEVSIVN